MITLRQDLKGCERFFLGIKTLNGEAVRYRVFPARCHSWNCRVCARAKADMYRVRMRPLFKSEQLFMYTFTFYHGKAPGEVWANSSACWNRFRTSATKRFGTFSYARVLEHHHQSPYPHLHIIADKYFPPTWLGPELQRAGFGYQTDCSQITSDGAAAYVTKYLTKPWTCEYSKCIRKSLHLRIISFGGNALTRKLDGTPWQMVYKSLFCKDVLDAIETDRDWTYGAHFSTTFEMAFDAYSEVTYVFKKPGFTEEEICDAVSI